MDNQELEQMIQHMEDVHEIENLLARYQYFHLGGGPEMGMSDCFVQHTDGGTLTCPMGRWIGLDGFNRWFGRSASNEEKFRADHGGHFMLFPDSSIVVEVAEDGQSARAMLTSPGMSGGMGLAGENLNNWFWLKVGFDFIKEDGEWKFYHYHMWEMFQSDYFRDISKGREFEDAPKVKQPDETIAPEFLYDPKSVQTMVAVPPVPYRSAADITHY